VFGLPWAVPDQGPLMPLGRHNQNSLMPTATSMAPVSLSSPVSLSRMRDIRCIEGVCSVSTLTNPSRHRITSAATVARGRPTPNEHRECEGKPGIRNAPGQGEEHGPQRQGACDKAGDDTDHQAFAMLMDLPRKARTRNHRPISPGVPPPKASSMRACPAPPSVRVISEAAGSARITAEPTWVRASAPTTRSRRTTAWRELTRYEARTVLPWPGSAHARLRTLCRAAGQGTARPSRGSLRTQDALPDSISIRTGSLPTEGSPRLARRRVPADG
jgi:hypothetical protein